MMTLTLVEFTKSINAKLWIALGLIVIGSVLNLFAEPTLRGMSLILGLSGSGLFIWDFIRLKSMGKNRPSWYTLCLYPWYLRKRGKANDDNDSDKLIFKVAVAVFAFSILCAMIGISSGHKADLANAAQPVVSEIIHRFNADVDCVKVYEMDKMADGLYRAKAMLSNTKVVDISIRENLKDGSIYVTILDE